MTHHANLSSFANELGRVLNGPKVRGIPNKAVALQLAYISVAAQHAYELTRGILAPSDSRLPAIVLARSLLEVTFQLVAVANNRSHLVPIFAQQFVKNRQFFPNPHTDPLHEQGLKNCAQREQDFKEALLPVIPYEAKDWDRKLSAFELAKAAGIPHFYTYYRVYSQFVHASPEALLKPMGDTGETISDPTISDPYTGAAACMARILITLQELRYMPEVSACIGELIKVEESTLQLARSY